MEALAGTILLIMFLAVAGYNLRLYSRIALRAWRERNVGEMKWYRLIPEGRSKNTGFDAESQTNSVKSFISSMGTRRKVTRPISSIIWHKDAETGLMFCYIGVEGEGLDQSSVVRLANGTNCRVEALDALPDINVNGACQALRTHTKPSEVDAFPKTIGPVAASLSKLNDISGVVVMNIEPMNDSERRRFNSNLIEEAVRRGGRAVEMSSQELTKQTSIITGSSCRGSISAYADSGSFESSRMMAQTAVSSINTLGSGYKVSKPGTSIEYTGSVSAVVLAALLILSMFAGMPPSFALPLLLLTAVLGAINHLPVIGWKALNAKYQKRGIILMPRYTFFSPRWYFGSLFNQNYRSSKSAREFEDDVAPRTAHPSGPEVFSIYGTSLTEFVSTPDSFRVVNVQGDGVPHIPIASNMRGANGIFIGKDGGWNDVYYNLEDLAYGGFFSGAQGSGKSNEMLCMYAGVAWASHKNEKGYRITPVWAETKGEGAYDAWKMVSKVPRSIFIDCHNPRSHFRLALEGRRLSDGATPAEVIKNSEALVSALQFAFGDGIKDESRRGLDYSIRIAMLLTPQEIQDLQIDHLVNPQKPNVIELAFLILGGNTNHDVGPALMKLAQEFEEEFTRQAKEGSVKDARKNSLYEAIITLSDMFSGSNSSRDRARQLAAPPRNKLAGLRNARTFWEPASDRYDVFIGQVVTHFAPVVLNMGPFWDPELINDSSGESGNFVQSFSTVVSKQLIKSFNYAMWNYIKTHCSGWQKQGKYIPMFFDEVKDISSDSTSEGTPNVLAEAGQQGRSRGCGYFVATQFPSQLPVAARQEVMAFRTKMWFNMHLQEDVELAHSSMTYGEADSEFNFSRSSISHLKNGTAIATIIRHDTTSQPFTLFTPFSKNMMDALNATEGNAPDAVRWHDDHDLGYTAAALKPSVAI